MNGFTSPSTSLQTTIRIHEMPCRRGAFSGGFYKRRKTRDSKDPSTGWRNLNLNEDIQIQRELTHDVMSVRAWAVCSIAMQRLSIELGARRREECSDDLFVLFMTTSLSTLLSGWIDSSCSCTTEGRLWKIMRCISSWLFYRSAIWM